MKSLWSWEEEVSHRRRERAYAFHLRNGVRITESLWKRNTGDAGLVTTTGCQRKERERREISSRIHMPDSFCMYHVYVVCKCGHKSETLHKSKHESLSVFSLLCHLLDFAVMIRMQLPCVWTAGKLRDSQSSLRLRGLKILVIYEFWSDGSTLK